MKNIFLFVFLFIIIGYKAQSKKEQIKILNYRIDSLKKVQNEIEISKKNLIENFQKDLSQLQVKNVSLLSTINIQYDSIQNLLTLLKKESDLYEKLNFENIKYKDSIIKLNSILTEKKSGVFEKCNEYRFVLINTDTLWLNPFELFCVLEFTGVSFGLNLTLDFKSVQNSEKYSFGVFEYNAKSNQGKELISNDSGECLNCEKITIELENGYDSLLKRKLEIGKTYNVIFAWNDDSLYMRNPLPGCNSIGYYLVDVLPKNELFERQKEKF